jgi:tetratricopeptide (TPR) repeat protein
MNEFADTHYQRASHLASLGRWPEALREAQKCLVEEPNHYRALCQISFCCLGLKDYAGSLEFAEKAIAANPNEEWAYRLQATLYQSQNKHKKAEQCAEQCVRAAPQNIYSLYILAEIQLELGHVKAARETAETMLAISPDSFEAHEMLGYIALNTFKNKEALIHFERALKINPESAEILSSYAWTLYANAQRLSPGVKRRELLKNAIDVYELSLRTQPNSIATKDNLKRAIDLYIISDIFSLITLTSLGLLGLLLFLIRNFNLQLPAFLDISQKPPELFIINVLMIIEIHLVGIISGYHRAVQKLSPQSQFFLKNQGTNWVAFPFLILYFLFLLIPMAIFGYRTSIYGLASIFEITVFDWLSIILTSVIFVIYSRFLLRKFKQTKLWRWLKLKTVGD